MEQPVVDVNDLSRSFEHKTALDGVSFRATAGQVYGLVGSNGAGKTTLLKHLLGLLRATTGSVRVFGLDPVRDPVGVLSRVGYLSEERELPEWMRVDELMRYTQAYHPTWDATYARELLETFALDPAKKIKDLSKGMRAQAGLIAAVAHRPELLILDEPSSGLDAVVRRDILDAIVRAVADDGRTVIFSSHLLDEVERMSDHVTLMHQGRVTLSGVLDDVRRDYQRSRVHFVEHFDQAARSRYRAGDGRWWPHVERASTADRSSSSVTRSSRAAVRSSNRATPRSKKSSWRAPAAAASRWRRHEPAFTHRRHAVGELAADARRGRSAYGAGACGGLCRADLCSTTARSMRSGSSSCCTPSSGFPLRSSMAAGSWTGTSPAFRSIFSIPVRSRRSCSSASPWRTTRSLAWRCTSHPRLSWGSLSASRCRCSP